MASLGHDEMVEPQELGSQTNSVGGLIEAPNEGSDRCNVLWRNLKIASKEYLDSFPGPHEAPQNIGLHDTCRQIAEAPQNIGLHDVYRQIAKGKGQGLTEEAQSTWHSMLKYRIGKMNDATRYKDLLEIDYPDCDKVDAELLYAEISDPTDKLHLIQAEKIKQTYRVITKFIDKLFEQPQGRRHYIYLKPEHYLALVFHSADCSHQAVWAALNELTKGIIVEEWQPPADPPSEFGLMPEPFKRRVFLPGFTAPRR